MVGKRQPDLQYFCVFSIIKIPRIQRYKRQNVRTSQLEENIVASPTCLYFDTQKRLIKRSQVTNEDAYVL